METPESCPRCGARMKEGKEPLRIRGIYVGSYDSMSCPVCKYYYFTEKEYELALGNARLLGVVGPPLQEVRAVVISEKLSIDPFYRLDRPTNLDVPKNVQTRVVPLVELPPITTPHDALASQTLEYIGK